MLYKELNEKGFSGIEVKEVGDGARIIIGFGL